MNDMERDEIHVMVPECADDDVSELMRNLTKCLSELDPESIAHGFLGGEFGYGCDFETPVFRMHPYCWCDRDECPWCNGSAPNYLHKPSGATVHWYKYIGRSMEIDAPQGFDWPAAVKESLESASTSEVAPK